jgi:hypothetical protein
MSNYCATCAPDDDRSLKMVSMQFHGKALDIEEDVARFERKIGVDSSRRIQCHADVVYEIDATQCRVALPEIRYEQVDFDCSADRRVRRFVLRIERDIRAIWRREWARGPRRRKFSWTRNGGDDLSRRPNFEPMGTTACWMGRKKRREHAKHIRLKPRTAK